MWHEFVVRSSNYLILNFRISGCQVYRISNYLYQILVKQQKYENNDKKNEFPYIPSFPSWRTFSSGYAAITAAYVAWRLAWIVR